MKADYRSIWEQQFEPHHDFVRKLATEQGYYGIYFPSKVPGKVDFIAGMAVAEDIKVPEDLVMREIPAARYAVLECKMDAIGSTWEAIYGGWLTDSEQYAEDESKACFEYFPPGADEGKALVSINVPLKSK
jgi:predicted transcriptional regulator YdeE